MESTRVFRLASMAAAVCVTGAARADSWPMHQRDPANTGRAGFVVPASRQGATLFDFFLWQTPTPGGGNVSSGQIVFFDGAGPGGADLAVGGYHWPKGVMGVDRHSGLVFWSGNTDGGESIGANTPAFSPSGSTVYVTNDATPGPLMAFASATGPASYWANTAVANPDSGAWSPKVLPDGRIATANWCSNIAFFTDSGTAFARVATASDTCSCYPTAAFYQDGPILRTFVASRCGFITCYDGAMGGQLWRINIAAGTDAAITVDPATGNMYVPIGGDGIWIVGLGPGGVPLWGGQAERLIAPAGAGERAQSGGALSHDGATYYFQTIGQSGNGRLYAISTASGALKWTYATQSSGEEMRASSPIVTPNGVIFVGNNNGGRYFALRDDGGNATLLDTMDVSPGGTAQGSASISSDGLLYLPMRTTWVVGNPSQSPDYTVQNLFTAIDLRTGASMTIFPPGQQRAWIGNGRVELRWTPVSGVPAAVFDHYAVYRDTQAFSSVAGRTPIATVTGLGSAGFIDSTASNGVSFWYAVTSVAVGGGQATAVASIGPRTPRDETDLQVLSISRSPRFERYAPIYSGQEVTEPSGFGPYWFSAATGLGAGQTASTPRWPSIGQAVTYTATVRNRGTNTWSGVLNGRWTVDSVVLGNPSQSVALAPNETATFAINRMWDGQLHDIGFSILNSDARPANNSLSVGSKSVGFLTYADRSFLEAYRENTPLAYPDAATDDVFDWLNRHMARFNAMFAAAGTHKRVHYEVLEPLDDVAPDPVVDQLQFAIFPFRYLAGQGDARLSGYYRPTEDIDYGQLHEMGHQLGLIDLYQFDIPPEANLVSGLGYTAPECLMRSVAPFLSVNSALAMEHWQETAHGYYGQYLYGLPSIIRMRFVGLNGQPLSGATVSMYQLTERSGVGKVISTQVKATGTTDGSGIWTLPNVPIDPALVPTTFAGDTLGPNPFGYVAVVGTNAVLHFKVQKGGFTDYAWLDITEPNNAYRQGQTGTVTFDRSMRLGGAVQLIPPNDMADLNAASWQGWADGGSYTIADDTARTVVGAGSIRCVTNGGFDTLASYPGDRLAQWDLTGRTAVRFWVYAENPNFAFQSQSPWVVLRDSEGASITIHPNGDILNSAIGQWQQYVVPLAGDNDWTRTAVGTPDLTRIAALEIHADTWGYGFTLWIDGVGFVPASRCSLADITGIGGPPSEPDLLLTGDDFNAFIAAFAAGDLLADVTGIGGPPSVPDGMLTGDDFNAFIAAFATGCP